MGQYNTNNNSQDQFWVGFLRERGIFSRVYPDEKFLLNMHNRYIVMNF